MTELVCQHHEVTIVYCTVVAAIGLDAFVDVHAGFNAGYDHISGTLSSGGYSNTW